MGSAAGKAWAIALCKHAPAAARFQYVHRAYAHDAEDKLRNGHRDSTDDSIIEKGHKHANKRKAQIFQGGTNETTKRVRRTQLAENEHGGITRTQSAPAALPLGRATQLHKLAHAAPEFVNQRPGKKPRAPKAGPKRVKSEKIEKARKRDSGQAGLVRALTARISGS